MIRTQFALYIHTDRFGKRSKTTWKMKPEDAAKLTDPEIIPSSIEWRNLPEPGESLAGPSLYPACPGSQAYGRTSGKDGGD